MVDSLINYEIEDGKVAKEEVVLEALLLILQQNWLYSFMIKLTNAFFCLLTR